MSELHDPIQHVLSHAGSLQALQTLSAAYPYLSNSEKAVTHYIMNNLHHAVTLSAAGLAQKTNVSEATIFRLCRQLGFSGYKDLRQQLHKAVHAYSPSFLTSMASETNAPSPQHLIQKTAYNGFRSLLDALSVNADNVQQAITAITRAERIILSGVGAYTARICEMAAFGLQRIGLTCMLWVNEQTSQIQPHMIWPNDVIIGLSYSGGNQGVARLLRVAKDVGASTIAVTNYMRSPVAEQSDIPLITACREVDIQNFELLPRLSQIFIMNLLVEGAKSELSRQRPVAQRRTLRTANPNT